jgi:hypothetical protein
MVSVKRAVEAVPLPGNNGELKPLYLEALTLVEKASQLRHERGSAALARPTSDRDIHDVAPAAPRG